MAKMRSPNYPALGLSDAIGRVDALWRKEQRTPVPPDVAATAMGFGALSGPSRTAMGALKKYGLVDSEAGNMRVSDLALRILHPADADDGLKATQEAALKPELFQQLYQSHGRASDTALTSHLINRLGFSTTGAKQVIKAFRDAMGLAKLDQTEYIPSAVASVAATMQSIQPSDTITMSDNVQIKLNTVNSWSWPLSIPRNVRAELKITGELTSGDVRRLKKQIEALEDAFDDSSDEENLPNS
jgi:hypothetical protein